jgi:hypothetical protein
VAPITAHRTPAAGPEEWAGAEELSTKLPEICSQNGLGPSRERCSGDLACRAIQRQERPNGITADLSQCQAGLSMGESWLSQATAISAAKP